MFNVFDQEEVKKTLIPIRLQFFAEGDDSGEEGSTDEDTNEEGDQNQSESGKGIKTFTQEDVNKMMKAEKDSGKRSVLKDFGFKDAKEGKAFMDKAKALIDSQKTDDEKKNDALNDEKNKRVEAEERASYLESKFTAMQEGVNTDVIDDILAIASLKVTDDKDLKTVITEMKKNQAYAGFFTSAEGSDKNNKGTGTGLGSRGNGSGASNKGLGARLAQGRSTETKATKSSYFSR